MIRIRRDAHELIPVTQKRVTWQKNCYRKKQTAE